MKRVVAFILLITSTLFSSLPAKESLYFGIIDNHRPHVYLDAEEQPSGSLVGYIQTLCEELDAGCNFLTGGFFNHLEALQSGQINALLITDSVLIPAVDEIIFTPPLCKISPVFIYKVKPSMPSVRSIDDVKHDIIGVHLDSSLHLYLLDEYYSKSQIKPYALLESGIFDLANDRVDALLAEHSFFEARIATTTLVSKKKSYQLGMLSAGKVELPFKTMSLALRARDTDLYKKLSKAIDAHGPTLSCVDLVRNTLEKDKSAEPSSDTPESNSPAQGNEANETAK